MILVWDCYI